MNLPFYLYFQHVVKREGVHVSLVGCRNNEGVFTLEKSLLHAVSTRVNRAKGLTGVFGLLCALYVYRYVYVRWVVDTISNDR